MPHRSPISTIPTVSFPSLERWVRRQAAALHRVLRDRAPHLCRQVGHVPRLDPGGDLPEVAEGVSVACAEGEQAAEDVEADLVAVGQ